MKIICFLTFFCCTSYKQYVSAQTSEWRTDATNITFGGVQGIRPWNMSVEAQANGDFFSEAYGHFRLGFTIETEDTGWVSGLSECIELGSSIAEVKSSLNEVEMQNDEGSVYLLSSLVDISVTKIGNGKEESSYRTVFEIDVDSTVAYSLFVELNFTGCHSLRTVGLWNSPENWVGGNIPSMESSVVFPRNSGVAILSDDITFANLHMLGGYIIAQTSGCADGWSPFMSGTTGYDTIFSVYSFLCKL